MAMTCQKSVTGNGLINHILVVNCGSSSLKLSLFEIDKENGLKRLLDAHVKGTNASNPILEIAFGQKKEIKKFNGVFSPKQIFEDTLSSLTPYGFSSSTLSAIGHRVVHGGIKYSKSTRITPSVLIDLEKLSDLAPLHNPACVEGIKNSIRYFGKKIPQIAVFDTAFHHSLPEYAAYYAIPKNLTKKYGIRRYGFHGISHAYLTGLYSKLKKNNKDSKLITLHLGNGCSATAIRGGISIDTSMGFTPLEGLVMGSRCGNMDPAVVEFLCKHEKKSPSAVLNLLNFESGLLGVSGKSSNMKTLLENEKKDRNARLAIDIFCYRIVQYIGAYYFTLGGLDALIFSGGIGENSAEIRSRILSKMKEMGIKIDIKKNKKAAFLKPGEVHPIHSKHSTADIYVIGTDENGFIASETKRVAG